MRKFILKNMFGSAGHTAKTLIDHFNRRNQLQMADEPNEIYVDILLERKGVSELTGQSIYKRLTYIDQVMNFIDNDICTFTFLVSFAESKNFRDSVQEDQYGRSSFKEITEAIYEVCKKRSALCYLSLPDFQTKAALISNYYLFHS